jgi:hypothetical protein
MDAKVQNHNEIKHQDHAPNLKGKRRNGIRGLSLSLQIGLP